MKAALTTILLTLLMSMGAWGTNINITKNYKAVEEKIGLAPLTLQDFTFADKKNIQVTLGVMFFWKHKVL